MASKLTFKNPFHKSNEDQAKTEDLKKKLDKYIAKPEVKELYSALKVSAQVIDGANKTVEFFSKPAVKDLLAKRLPAIAAKLGKLAKFASVLGPAGEALGVVVDLLSAFGLLQDPMMAKLDEIISEIKGLRNDVRKGFDELKKRLDKNLALTQFLIVYNKVKAQVDIYERNVGDHTTDPANLYNRLVDMVKSYTPHDLIVDLDQLHTIIMGTTEFGEPLFVQLAKEKDEYDGDAFDNFMVTLFNQFHFVIALQIRAIRMLRSFLALTEQGPQFKTDLTAILKNVGTQRSKCDPLPTFERYLNFRQHGGKFEMKALKPNEFLYMEWGNHRVSGTSSEPGQKGHFKIDPCEKDAGFLVTCRYYPGECMQLQSNEDDGDVMSTTDIHDRQCHWLFHIKNLEEMVFKLSTVKWSKRYVYMQDDSYTEIRAAPKDAADSEQAQFKLIPFDWK